MVAAGGQHLDHAPTNADERGIPAFVSIHHGTDRTWTNGDPNSGHLRILEGYRVGAGRRHGGSGSSL